MLDPMSARKIVRRGRGPTLPLSGITVIDLSHVYNGLCDLPDGHAGAEVIQGRAAPGRASAQPRRHGRGRASSKC